jgi:SanA protein
MRLKPKQVKFIAIVVVVLFSALIFALPTILVDQKTQKYIYSSGDEITSNVILVPGASVFNDKPSAVLARRLDTALYLVKSHPDKYSQVIFSGATDGASYNEPDIMEQYFLESLESIETETTTDYYGKRTFDSCYRAKYIYGAESVVIVTQEFHLNRAIFTCRHLGLTAYGVAADDTTKPTQDNKARESLANWKMLYDLFINKPEVSEEK